jgi:hypothetical protein
MTHRWPPSFMTILLVCVAACAKPPTPSAAASEPSTEPPLTPVATARLVGIGGWRALPDPEVFQGGLVEGIVAAPGGYVAVGCQANSGIECEIPAIWTSEDSVVWSAAAALPVLSGETNGVARAAAQTPAGLVVGGLALVDDRPHATLWFSTDSRSFERVAENPSFADAAVVALTTASDRFVAVGAGAYGELAGFRAWSSDAGRMWVDASPDGSDESFPVGLLALENRLIAWGPTCGVCVTKTAWWRSDDGLAWTATGNELGTAGFINVTAVVESDEGLLAFGTTGGGNHPVEPAAWSLAIGADRWEPVLPPAQPEGTVVRHYLRVGSGAVLAGTSSAAQMTGLVWTSGPGDTGFRPTLQLPGVEVIGLARDPAQLDRVNVVGRSSDGGRIVLWTGMLDWAP